MKYRNTLLALILLCTSILSGQTAAQTFEETTGFITEITSIQGVLRSLGCQKENGLTMVTPIYTMIPSGTNNGLIEFNHGRENSNTGYTKMDLHDLQSVEYRGVEQVDQSRRYHAVRFTCTESACIEKVTFCPGSIPERQLQFSEDTLYFRGASSAERVAKAFTHLMSLIHSTRKAPF